MKIVGRLRYRLWLTRVGRSKIFTRLRHGLRYALGRMSEEDARDMFYGVCDTAGWYPLAILGRDDVAQECLDEWGEVEGIEHLIDAACRHVHSKWSTDGSVADAARGWARELVIDYAKQAGIELPDEWGAEAETEEATAAG